ncbi:hypothetical protein NRIC_13730 [Enterococcus florum]|uniref:Uncharacterized protein n=1 Tax=Enterococcus florum TaxID=2480627 RepID=A0A4P5PD82_9ENTE|nr:cell division site-positioning protein MapZ family protein [Enterococcus florum]GCF93482.1 hypothetical protein NRIC_13730 [Enterococcus florum]
MKCPNCQAELDERLAICLSCGFSLTTDHSQKDIEWSELAQMTIEEVEQHFEQHSKDIEEEDSKEETNPILAEYIREHKEEATPDPKPKPIEIDLSQKADDSPEEKVEEEPKPPEVNKEPEEPPLENESEPSTNAGSSKPRHSSHKLRYFALVAVLIFCVWSGYQYYSVKQAEAKEIELAKKENQQVKQVKSAIADFYTDKQQTFLKPEALEKDTTDLKKLIEDHKDHQAYTQLQSAYDRLVEKQKLTQSVNQLFTAPAIQGDALADSLQLKSDQAILLTANTADQSFNQLMNQAITTAKEQRAKLEIAKQMTEQLLSEETLTESATREQYDAAKTAVAAVANQALVEPQKQELTKVEQALTEKEAQAAEQARQTPLFQTNRQNLPILNQDQGQINDASNPAWTWNAGIQSKVIQTCIDRGYIVEGGYSLEPVQIINGEGYYNLYATSNRAPLTSGYSASDLPMYLVTINCKTGWFQGNGGH